MRRLHFLLAFACILSAQTDANKLLGRWRSADSSLNGRAVFFDFHDGNRMDYVSGEAIDGHYRLIDAKTIEVSTPEHGEEQEEMSWSGADRLVIENKTSNQSVSLERVGKMPDSEHPIAGDWATERVVDGNKVEALCIFYPDGRNLWVIKLKSLQGTYTVSGEVIKLEVPERPAAEGSFAINGDTLLLPNPGGHGSSRFSRY